MAASRFGPKFGRKLLLGAGVAGGVALGVALESSPVVKADLLLHPPHLKWPHSGVLDSFDHNSIRRGYQVYKQVELPHVMIIQIGIISVLFLGIII